MLLIMHFIKNKNNIFSKFTALHWYFVIFLKYIQQKNNKYYQSGSQKPNFSKKCCIMKAFTLKITTFAVPENF